MPQNPLPACKIRRLLQLCLIDNFSKNQTARRLRIARNSVRKYVEAFRRSTLTPSDIKHAGRAEFASLLFPGHGRPTQSDRKIRLLGRLVSVHSRIEHDGLSILDAWREEVASNQCSYKYSQFASLYVSWREDRGLQRRSRAKSQSVSIKLLDLQTFKSWQRSHDRSKWEVSTALLGLSSGRSLSELCNKIGRARRTMQKWCLAYEQAGIDGLALKRSRRLSEKSQAAIKDKKDRLIKIIHETPKAYGINRASWSLQALSDAYEKTHGERTSRSSISEYFISAGYKFKKAKKSLTSSDPTYREKLAKITSALSHLAPDEKFFSIDEFGPFSVKIRGGVALVPGDEVRTIPQRQRSKGSLICTAALELSSNQVTHFYSKKKNSKEMIKLLRRLVILYKGENRIFLSWDSASWHASKAVYKIVDELNDNKCRSRHNTPMVVLMPLPSGAQFLNVIESVFSGMARAILHNSNYGSVDECKAAIDMYFATRNQTFLEYPRRAGKKIWGKERVEAVFREENNCKDPRWR
jgi:transposase